jgi:hypothetical protein
MTIFLQKNGIFIFLKIPIKIRTKNIYYYFRIFYFVIFKKNKKCKSWAKVGQKSWAFNIFLIYIYIFVLVLIGKSIPCFPVLLLQKKKQSHININIINLVKTASKLPGPIKARESDRMT